VLKPFFKATVILQNRTCYAGSFNPGRRQLKCDGTRPETRFRLSTKRTSSFKSAGALVQSTTGSISGSNAGYTSFPFTSLPARHRVPSHFNWTLLRIGRRRRSTRGACARWHSTRTAQSTAA
jgi:hypothetical protein